MNNQFERMGNRERAARQIAFITEWDKQWAALSEEERQIITGFPLEEEAEAFRRRVEIAVDQALEELDKQER